LTESGPRPRRAVWAAACIENGASSDAILLEAKIAHLRKTLDRLQVAIGPECVLLH
jgi:hypothetical protein